MTLKTNRVVKATCNIEFARGWAVLSQEYRSLGIDMHRYVQYTYITANV